MDNKTLIERIKDPENKTLDPHEVAKELTKYFRENDADAVKMLKKAYLKGLRSRFPKKPIKKISGIVNENLAFAGELADVVSRCGYEASGQLLVNPRYEGPVAKFVIKAIGYKP